MRYLLELFSDFLDRRQVRKNCNSCEHLRMLLAQEKREKEHLLNHILKESVEVESDEETEELKPIRGGRISIGDAIRKAEADSLLKSKQLRDEENQRRTSAES